MHVTWLGHAALFVNLAERSVLIDPWFHEPIFADRWVRYPPPRFPDPSNLPKPDVVCLSRPRDDHAGVETLRQLRRDQLVLALDSPSGAMRRRLEAAGLGNVRFVQPWDPAEILPGLRVTFVPEADSERATIVLGGDGKTLVHGGERTPSPAIARALAERLGPVEVAFLFTGDASAAPGSHAEDASSSGARCARARAADLQHFLDAVDGLRPAEVAALTPTWALLDAARAPALLAERLTAAELLGRAVGFAHERGVHLNHLEAGDEWTPESGAHPRGSTAQWPQTAEAMARFVAQRAPPAPFPAAMPESALDAALEDAFAREPRPEGDGARLEFGLRAGERAWTVELSGGRPHRLTPGLATPGLHTLSVSPGALEAVLRGEWTWDDVWLGRRVTVSSPVDEGEAPAIWRALRAIDAARAGKRRAP